MACQTQRGVFYETPCSIFCSGRVCDLLRAEPDQHEHREVLRHRVPPQVPLSVHRVSGDLALASMLTCLCDSLTQGPESCWPRMASCLHPCSTKKLDSGKRNAQ